MIHKDLPSRKRVKKAGDAVRNGTPQDEDLKVIDEWRAAHRTVLNTFQATLRNRASKLHDKNITVAQRHKRRNTIFNKLKRFPSMHLARMDDIAGCRLIFDNIEDLRLFRRDMHQSRFKHVLRNEEDKYNYIKSPKETGYRGIHDVYSYNVSSKNCGIYNGLSIEIQYRTRVQHAWATAVEVVGYITQGRSQPKFDQGNDKYKFAMQVASEVLARAYENSFSCFRGKSNHEIVSMFKYIDNKTSLIDLFKKINSEHINNYKYKNIILIIKKDSSLEVKTYKSAVLAMDGLFELEKNLPSDTDLVLVGGSSSKDVQEAFRNYFSDTTDFVQLIENGLKILSEDIL